MSSSKPTGHFLDDAHWNSRKGTVDFTLVVQQDGNEERITCRASTGALLNRAKSSGDGDYLGLFRTYQSEVERVVDRKLKIGIRETDGSIVVNSADLN